MFRGYKIIDADSHLMEPQDLWDRYREPSFKSYPIHHVLLEGDPPTFTLEVDMDGFRMPIGRAHLPESKKTERPKYILGKDGVPKDYSEAYAHWIAEEFSPESYVDYLDMTGIDYMVMYTTAGLFITSIPGMDPAVAAALCRAYNNWLYDFCNRGQGRLVGVGRIDTRDPEVAAMEARRCVNELGFKAITLVPQMEDGTSLSDGKMDVLWGEISDLNVPLGLHQANGTAMIPVGVREVGDLALGQACAFPLENMITFLAMASGPLERFPELDVIFLESSATWVPFWVWWLDDRWERLGENVDTPNPPSTYWKRQCYISSEPDEPGIKYVKDFQGDDNIITASDFPHPEDVLFPHVLEKFVDSPHLSEETKRKILWDNPARLYRIDG